MAECNICDLVADEFEPIGLRRNARCPQCKAVERHRLLHALLEVHPAQGRLLEISPQLGPLRRRLLERSDHYVGLDIEDKRRIDVRGDLTRLPFRDASFDVVICFHVLEHVPGDRAAMTELARVLHPDGTAFVQVPIRRNAPTDEDPSAPPDERARRFGQANHLRFYGDDFDGRLAAHGLESERRYPEQVLGPELMRRFAITSQPIWVCRRASVLSGAAR